MGKVLFTAILLILIVVPVAGGWELNEFMLSTWGGPEIKDDNAKIQALKNAGFNTAMFDVGKLDICLKYGIKAIVDGATPEIASKLKNDNMVWGYHLVDEPETDLFPELARQVKAFRDADPNHPVYINLFARSGEHIREFIDMVKPDFLSYDYYQWWYGDYQKWWEGDTGYFARLEQHREAAFKAGIPLICWVEVTANKHDDRYKNVPLPSDSNPKVRQSVYTSLAYGVKGIQWFHGRLLFEKESAELNECGRHVASINRELELLGPVLIKLYSQNVFHTKPLPRSTRETYPQHWVVPEGDNLVVGLFQNNDKNDFIMITNRCVQHGSRAILRFQRKIKTVEMFDKHTGLWQPLEIKEVQDFKNAYDPESLEKFLGVPTRAHDRLVHLRNINSYLPPYQSVEFLLAPGDGELLRVN
ncbi:MAG: hypothetical protein JXB48_18330 [Candidatus Latescibacteria bacterium]|nr:hypothetical protein [Candidatus Latescibacterota bacterium]